MESKMKHLEMIQNIISRMASNSFLLKGWTVTIVVGLFAFANIKDMDTKFILLAFVPAIMFWLLDAYFIQQEWLFRNLYEHTATLKEKEINFSMKIKSFKSKENSWGKAIISNTLVLFYIPILIIISLTLIISIIENENVIKMFI